MYIIFYLINAMGEGIWVALKESDYYRWIAVALSSICFILLLPNLYLAFFHCYISFFKYGTTLKYLRGEDDD